MADEKAKEAEKSTGDEKTSQKPSGKRVGSRKDLPSVAYLLAHGDPETAHLPKSWKETVGFPLVVAIVFFLSLLTFHFAPHSKSTHPGFKLPQRKQPLMKPESIPEPVETPPSDEL